MHVFFTIDSLFHALLIVAIGILSNEVQLNWDED